MRARRNPTGRAKPWQHATESQASLAVELGLGAVALAMLEDGYRVVIAGRRKEPLEQVIALARVDSNRALAVPTDVSNPASVRALFAKTQESFGRLDVLFNNAGVGAPPLHRWKI